MKKTIRLSERDLHRVIKESVKNVLKEEIVGPTCFSVQELAYHNQHIRQKIHEVIEFCETASHIVKTHSNKEDVAQFYHNLANQLRDMETHAFWDLDNADD